MTASSEKNLYEILEISPFATQAMIKGAYRKLVRIYHPDINGGNKACTEKFKEITEAYEILSDETQRRNYDILKNIKINTYRTNPQDSENPQFRENKKSEYKKNFCDDTFSELLNEFWTGFKKTTESYRKNHTPKPQRGSDVESEITITISEAKQGCIRTVNILHTQICQNCQGRTFLNGNTCPICKGKGVQSVHKKINVKVPKNVKHGSKIRLQGEGNKGHNGGGNGDLYLKIKVENDSPFKIEGKNILYDLSITPFEAVLGSIIHIDTPNGKVAMKLMPNTQNGQKFKLANEGLSQNNEKGDMIIKVRIEIPKKLSPQEIALYNQLKIINNTDIREN